MTEQGERDSTLLGKVHPPAWPRRLGANEPPALLEGLQAAAKAAVPRLG